MEFMSCIVIIVKDSIFTLKQSGIVTFCVVRKIFYLGLKPCRI